MENLIDFSDTPPVLLQNSVPSASDKLFGIIKREFFAVEVPGFDESNGEALQPGILIQIMPGYHGDNYCHFKIRNFNKWLEKYKTATYKCTKDDYIAVKVELWPYLLALKNDEGRINLVQRVYNQQFDLNILQLGSEIRIQASNLENYYEFIVIYNGVVKEMGTGHYIGLQLKNGKDSLTSELRNLSRYYRFEGTGIVVPVDWIMLNLYKKKYKTITPNNESSIDDTAFEAKKHNLHSSKPLRVWMTSGNQVLPTSPVKEELEKTIETNILSIKNAQPPNPCDTTSNYAAEIECATNTDGAVKNAEKTKCDLCSQTVEIGTGIILRECLHSFCRRCISNHVKHNSNLSEIQCPHNTEYNCESNLLDIEIKDLGGKILYNNILDKRFKEYVHVDPNARVCPNEKCKYVWQSERDTNAKYERCPLCKVNWCFSCNNIHEPSEEHVYTGKTNLAKIQNWVSTKVLRAKPTEPDGICAKCRRTNIPAPDYFTLQNCNHTFCNDCILPMIKTQTSGSMYPQCNVCNTRIEDVDVINIAGSEVHNLFLGNRKKTITEICVCKPSVGNCLIINLKCNHSFCPTYLADTLRTQFKVNNYCACPLCLTKINDDQIRQLVPGLNAGESVKKCINCYKQAAVVRLTICQHEFCQKCVCDMITEQVSDPNVIGVFCKACHEPITDGDVSKYGGGEIFAKFKLKSETTKLPKSVDQIKLNDEPFECVSCEEQIPMKGGIILAGCNHLICFACSKENITLQLSASQKPACIVCRTQLTQFEVHGLAGNIGISVVECLKCEEKFEPSLIQKCSKCASSICFKCNESTVKRQLEKNLPASCPFCQVLLDGSKNDGLNEEPKSGNCDVSDISYAPFECVVCEQSPDRAFQIELHNCKHQVCRNCLQENILLQKKWSSIPICPICSKPIDEVQLAQFGFSTISKTDVLNLAGAGVQSNSGSNATLRSNKDPFECPICELVINSGCGIQLTNCDHLFCRACFSEVMLEQTKHGHLPNCVLCKIKISDEEIRAFASSPSVLKSRY